MPKFDPVRDAVMNSPLTPGPSPSLPRRATDLAVLLNADAPQQSRRPTLTHLLHVPADHDDKLQSSQPLRRHQSVADHDDDTALRHPRRPGSSPSRRSPAQSPVFSRPSSSSSSSFQQPHSSSTPRSTVSPTMQPPPLPQLPTTIPYDPRKRVTPAQSILKPMSQAEMAMYKHYHGKGTSRLTKRKRERSNDADDRDRPPAKKAAGDVGMVIDHYNSRPEVGVVQRLDSPIIGLKNFNNWVKSVLISRFAHPALHQKPQQSSGPGRGQAGKVLDMGCGKGGDLSKWAKAKVREYMGADIAAISVEQARQRWESQRGARFSATFAALDCYTQPLSQAFSLDLLRQPFDVVSMQFCMHYAFETEQKARCMLDNVSRWLRRGGVFIGTIPNAEQLLQNLDDLPASAEDLTFGNSVYKIRFENRKHRPVFGHKYWFFLQDAVEDVPEYIVHWDHFVQLASEYNLYPVYKEEFHHVFEEHQEHPEFGPLMVRMKVVDANGESSMDEDQWEAANIYIAFAFEKR